MNHRAPSRDVLLATDPSDQALLARLASLCLEGRRLLARVIECLLEVEDRGLDKRSACSSMWEFCIKRLGMSEGEAARRLNAVRLVRRFPSLLGRIERGEIHLSALQILGSHLGASNVDALLDAARGKTKIEVMELVARIHPRPDTPSVTIEMPSGTSETPALISRGDGSPAPARVEPLSPARYLVQVTLSQRGYENLQRAKDLLRHRVPGGDTAEILEQALRALVEKAEKERLGKTSRPQRRVRPSRAGHVPRAVRRDVFARDGERCTYVDPAGRRCESRALLELDHIEPRARGGPDDTSNLRVRCRAHNRMHAEDIFGKEHVARRIHCRQRKSQRVSVAPAGSTDGGAHAIAHPLLSDAIGHASRGLVRMGFGARDVRRVLEAIHARGAFVGPLSVQQVLREALAALA
jgi:hypothetical protein